MFLQSLTGSGVIASCLIHVCVNLVAADLWMEIWQGRPTWLNVHPIGGLIKMEFKSSLQQCPALPSKPALLCPEATQFSCCLQEFDFVLSDMALEVIGDFAVVWLLSPTRSFTPRAKSGLARYINALPGHALQVPSMNPHLTPCLPQSYLSLPQPFASQVH